MLSNDYRRLEDLRSLGGKCVRCSLCKFPPLTMVERKEFSTICPAYDEFMGHFNSGGGLVVMGSSLVDGRSRVTEAVRQAVYRCTACGGCDVSCKFNSDIEIQEILLALRARVLSEIGPLPGHAQVLDVLRREGHPLPDADAPPGAWREAVSPTDDRRAPTLLWVGPHFARLRHNWSHLATIFRLLETLGVAYRLLDDEPYVGRAALEIGDQELFAGLATRTAEAIRESRAQRVVCLSAEDYATLRGHVPRYAPLATRVSHLVEVYAERLSTGRFRPRHRQPHAVGWHDSPYLGRLSEPYEPWRGEEKKIFGQMVLTVPARPINHGSGGCYDPPRRVLKALPGLVVREFHRRREYAYDAGETGQAGRVFPDLAAHTAVRRIFEARSAGIDRIACECPQTRAQLASACESRPELNVGVTTLTGLLAHGLLGSEERSAR